MTELVTALENLGLRSVQTYIQSGNAVFESKAGDSEILADEIRSAIRTHHGFEPTVVLLEAAALAHAIESNPYPEAESEPNTLHLNFLASVPTAPDFEAMAKIQTETERFHLAGRVCYLHAPEGLGRSKLGAAMERLLGVPMTSRNWRTVRALMQLATRAP